ncbi:MAG: GGDEF domain-containing protein [Treponema sp.]|nr:GGDEF domain-containing protein [Treponema sp.]
MNSSFSVSIIYPLISAGLVLVLIFSDFITHSDTDYFQRRVFLASVIVIFADLVFGTANTFFNGMNGQAVHVILYITNSLYFVFQYLSYYMAVLYIDYMINKNINRAKTFIWIIIGIIAAVLVFLLFNLFYGFYFSITGENLFVKGRQFIIPFIFGYGAIILAAVDLIISVKFIKGNQLYVIAFFTILIGVGAGFDFFFETNYVVWNCFTGALLYCYFTILRSDTTTDRVTGIGNRASFNEFINQINHVSKKQSYAMALFDINGLKAINDKLGMEYGDYALVDLADILKRCTRQSDFIARIGPDEFIVAIKAKFDIEKLLLRFLRMMETYNQTTERSFKLSVSYGYDTYTSHTDQPTDEFLTRLYTLVFRHKSDQKEVASHE